MEGWELSTPQAALKRDVDLIMAKLEKRTTASQNAQTKTAVISVHLVRPISDHGEDAVSIQRAKAKAQASTPEAKLAAMLALIKKAPKAEIRATPPLKPANEFEAGAVQGVIMFETAVAAELCPSCFVAAGSMNIYNGVKAKDNHRTFKGFIQLGAGIGVIATNQRPFSDGLKSLSAAPETIQPLNFFISSDGSMPWPPIDGFANQPANTILMPGTMLDRWGYDNGTFVSPIGVPISARSLKPGTTNNPYSVFLVRNPIEVEAGEAAAWFGENGGGMQYRLPRAIEDLLKDESLIKISTTQKN